MSPRNKSLVYVECSDSCWSLSFFILSSFLNGSFIFFLPQFLPPVRLRDLTEIVIIYPDRDFSVGLTGRFTAVGGLDIIFIVVTHRVILNEIRNPFPAFIFFFVSTFTGLKFFTQGVVASEIIIAEDELDVFFADYSNASSRSITPLLWGCALGGF